MSTPMPVIFFGHGNPMTTLSDNTYTRGWAAIGADIPRPKAVLSISAHWYVPATLVTAMPRPGTVHDFGGFPRELFEIEYPAPGAPDLAGHIQDLLSGISVGRDERWGLDHGTWTVLRHVFPAADVPVVQLSLDEMQPPAFHYELAQQLAPLRDEGVLIVGSGNVVHNLRAYSWDRLDDEPPDWAVRFDRRVRERVIEGDDRSLIEYEKLGPDAILSAPSPEHYLPLLYVIALRRAGDRVRFPVEGFDGGSMSMRAVQIG